MIIIGAGLSGLIAGALHAQARIFEAGKQKQISHRAVLRFRSDKISRALGIPFRRVTVHKSVYADGAHQPITPSLANRYSLKVRAVVQDSSIWSKAPAERWIAPEDFHAQLIALCRSRIEWSAPATEAHLEAWRSASETVISTMPLPSLLKLLHYELRIPFAYQSIVVHRYRVRDADVFQTVYFPDAASSLYRATLTGELLTLECVAQAGHYAADDPLTQALDAFGLDGDGLELVDANHEQKFGKIIPLPDAQRKALLHQITQQHGIYTLGRFATWRNSLLDDVFDDIAVIRRMQQQSPYDNSLERTKS